MMFFKCIKLLSANVANIIEDTSKRRSRDPSPRTGLALPCDAGGEGEGGENWILVVSGRANLGFSGDM